MNLEPGKILSRAVLGWAPAFDQFDKRNYDLPVTVDEFANLLAARVFDNATKEQKESAYCVALFLRNNFLEAVKPDDHRRPPASKDTPKAPSWQIKRWLDAFRTHQISMKPELAELRELGLSAVEL